LIRHHNRDAPASTFANCSGANFTIFDSPLLSSQAVATRFLISARSTPFTGSFETLRNSALILAQRLVFPIQLRGHKGIAHRHPAAGSQKNFFPDPIPYPVCRFQSTHVIPRSYFSGANTSTAIAFAFPLQSPAHVEFVGAIGASYVSRIRHLVPVTQMFGGS